MSFHKSICLLDQLGPEVGIFLQFTNDRDGVDIKDDRQDKPNDQQDKLDIALVPTRSPVHGLMKPVFNMACEFDKISLRIYPETVKEILGILGHLVFDGIV